MSRKRTNVSEHYRKVNINYNNKNNRFKKEYAKIIGSLSNSVGEQ